jgi:chromosome segregation ATPase
MDGKQGDFFYGAAITNPERAVNFGNAAGTGNNTNNTPALWWVNPWGYALNLKRALDAVHLLSQATQDAYQSANDVIKQKEDELRKAVDRAEAWKMQAEAVGASSRDLLDRRDSHIDELYADKASLKANLAVMTEDRDAYIEKLEKATAGRTLLVSRDKQIDGLFADIEREKQKVEAITRMVNERDRMINTRDEEIIRLTNLTRNLKRKLSKAEKAAGIKPAKKGARRA